MRQKAFAMLRVVGVMLLLAVGYPAPAGAAPIGSCVPYAHGGCIVGDKIFSTGPFDLGRLYSSPGVLVSSLIATYTPDHITFSTDYGLGGAIQQCVGIINSATDPLGFCFVPEEGDFGFNVSTVDGSARLNGLRLSSEITGGQVSAVACLGAGNFSSPRNAGFFGYNSSQIPLICPKDPSSAVGLNLGLLVPPFGQGPAFAIFPPVSAISVAVSLGVLPFGPGVPPITFQVSEVPLPSTLLLVVAALTMLAAFCAWVSKVFAPKEE